MFARAGQRLYNKCKGGEMKNRGWKGMGTEGNKRTSFLPSFSSFSFSSPSPYYSPSLFFSAFSSNRKSLFIILLILLPLSLPPLPSFPSPLPSPPSFPLLNIRRRYWVVVLTQFYVGGKSVKWVNGRAVGISNYCKELC